MLGVDSFALTHSHHDHELVGDSHVQSHSHLHGHDVSFAHWAKAIKTVFNEIPQKMYGYPERFEDNNNWRGSEMTCCCWHPSLPTEPERYGWVAPLPRAQSPGPVLGFTRPESAILPSDSPSV